MRYPVILLDLFRTVVLYRDGTATNQVHDPDWRDAMKALAPRFREVWPEIEMDPFLDALVAASDEVAAARGTEQREFPIEIRYERAVRTAGLRGSTLTTAARLAAVQLEAQMAGTVLPDEHREVLAELASSRELALVSNFDHSRSVRDMLKRHGIDKFFSVILISVEYGTRKPHPDIFLAAIETIGASPRDALHVGDSFGPDVRGAQASGIDVAWINPGGAPVPEGATPPTYEISSLTDVPRVLDPGEIRTGKMV